MYEWIDEQITLMATVKRASLMFIGVTETCFDITFSSSYQPFWNLKSDFCVDGWMVNTARTLKRIRKPYSGNFKVFEAKCSFILFGV